MTDTVVNEDQVTSSAEDMPEDDLPVSKTLYNVYRPRRFDEVIGQHDSVTGLKNAVISHQPSQAYLFTGSRGCGKTSTARIFAAALNCRFSENGEPCGQCDDCTSTLAGDPASGTYEVNATDARGIGDMREFLSKVGIGLSNSAYQIQIIDEVHQLTPEAQSILLKPIEEPVNSRVIFIMCTTNPEKLLSTTRSRSTRVHFRDIDNSDLRGLAERIISEEGFSVDETDIENIVRSGRGSARDMVSNLQSFVQGFGMPKADLAFKIVSNMVDKNVAACLTITAENAKSLDVFGTLEYILAFYRDVMLFQQNTELVQGSDEYMERIKTCSERYSRNEVLRFLQVTADAFDQARTKASDQIALEGYIARICIQETVTSNEALASEVKKLHKIVMEMRTMMINGSAATVSSDSDPASDPWGIVSSDEDDDQWPPENSVATKSSGGNNRRRRRSVPSHSSNDNDVNAESSDSAENDDQEATEGRSQRRSSRRRRSTRSNDSERSESDSDASDESQDDENDKQEEHKPRRRRRKKPLDNESTSDDQDKDESESKDDDEDKSEREEDTQDDSAPEQDDNIGEDFEQKWQNFIDSNLVTGRLRNRVESASLSRKGDTLVVKTDLRLAQRAKEAIGQFFDSVEYLQD